MGLIEVVHDSDEFFSRVDPLKPKHHNITWEPTETAYNQVMGIIVKLKVSGISQDGWIIRYVESNNINYEDPELKEYYPGKSRNLNDAFKKFIDLKKIQLDKKARSMGSTPGNFYYISERDVYGTEK